ncbi:hypothetical protein IAQ67_29150 (plasmid) [Paenibacillus peoriae]|uniref:SLH domain-containing protein n=1 Tax=Paenibacillus peoriae TaxID=59893 RepID=A0A7H0YH64_9BACL|nr:hypothetical protein [Paenibacillus peoriae]QNR70422.1 hypothetical protein IAQ67_29150 [Paenibacillus peoriae]
MNRWIDIQPYAWYYRDVLEASRTVLDPISGETLFKGIPYNGFKTGQQRLVQSYVSKEDQTEFAFPGYVPSDDNPVIAYVEGVPTYVDADKDVVYMPNPLSAGLQVVLMAGGEPDMKADGCRNAPYLKTVGIYPSAKLAHAPGYVYNVNYKLNEMATALGRRLRRVDLDLSYGQTIQEAMQEQVKYKTNTFTIKGGVLYTSYDLHNVPVTVEYNYKKASGGLYHTKETVTPTSGIVEYNDRFFPDVVTTKAEFMLVLQRMRINLYNRFTDREYEVMPNNERGIKDIGYGYYYADDVLDLLNEKYLDGCYVFPLYEDNTFNPEGCLRRSEAAVYLHRFIEWVLERFR